MIKCALEDLSNRVQGYFYEFDNIHQEDDIHNTALTGELSSNSVKLQVGLVFKGFHWSLCRFHRIGSLISGERSTLMDCQVLRRNDLCPKKKR